MSSHKNSKNRRIQVQDYPNNGSNIFVLFLFVSICFHVLFFISLIFIQGFNISKPLPPVIQIDLVSFALDPALEDPGKATEDVKDEVIEDAKDEGIPVKAAPIKKKPKKIPTIKPDISLKTKPKNLKDLIAQQEKKKKEIKKSETKKPVKKPKPTKAPDDVEKESKEKVDKQTQDTIAQALSRLKDKVREQGEVSDESASQKGVGKKGYKPIDLYNLVIGSTIEQNWVFNDILAKMDQELEVRILIKILKSGEIRDIIYETKSGNRYLDESAKKAVKKANPLPSLPAGLHAYDVGLIFTPRGLK